MGNFSILSQVFATALACMGSFLYGIALGWSSPSTVKMLDTEKTIDITLEQMSWAVSMNSLGAMVACFANGIIRDRFGTKAATLIFTIPNFGGWMLLAFAQYWWMVVLGRLLIGIATGGYGYIVLIYIGECASKQIRGILLTFHEIFLKVGILFIYILGALLDLKSMNLICGGICVAYGIGFLFLPESPWYLLKQHKNEEARKSLKYWRGDFYNVDEELQSIEQEMSELEKVNRPFWKEIRQESTLNAFIIIITMFSFFQMCGINAIVFYTTTILKISGIKSDPFVASTILGFIQLASGFLATVFIDRYGRKILFIISNAIMVVGLAGVGVYFHMQDTVDVSGYEYTPLILLCVYLIGFSIGVGSITYILIGELFSYNAKRVIGPLSQSTDYIMSFVIAIVFPIFSTEVGIQYTFFIFSACCALAIVYIIIKLPETKGKSLIEIQQLLTKKN